MKNPEIIFEDNDIIVCYKPSGIATQTKKLGQQDMVSILKNYRAKKKEPAYIGVIHRLDQPVEGVMVFAKNEKSAAGLSKQVTNRNIGKYYYAIGVVGNERCVIGENTTVLTDYMTFDNRTNVGKIIEDEISEARLKQDKNIKEARLEYSVIEKKDNLVCMDIKLCTGRHHQIRLQMAHAGMPLLGDSKYGTAVVGQQIALCSYKLEFIHPVTDKKLEFEIKPQNKLFADNFTEFKLSAH